MLREVSRRASQGGRDPEVSDPWAKTGEFPPKEAVTNAATNKARNRVAAGNLETPIALMRFNIVRIIIVLFYSIVGSPAKTDGIKLCLYVIFVELH